MKNENTSKAQGIISSEMFSKLDERIKNSIIPQSKCEKQAVSKNSAYINGLKEYEFKYFKCGLRGTYLEEAQLILDSFFKCPTTTNSKKLHLFLNINSNYEPELFTSNELMQELNSKFYAQQDAKKAIIKAFENSSNPNSDGVRIAIIGSTASGKSLLAKIIAEFRCKPYAVFDCSAHNSYLIPGGSSSMYNEALCGEIAQRLYEMRTTDATLIFDHIESAPHGSKDGDADRCYISVVREKILTDAYIQAPIDLKKTAIIALISDENKIKKDLLESFTTVIRLDEYTDEDKVNIAEHHVIPKLCKKLGVNQNPLTHSQIEYIIDNFSVNEGCSDLENCFYTLLSKNKDSFTFDEINDYLDYDSVSKSDNSILKRNIYRFNETDKKTIKKLMAETSDSNENEAQKIIARAKLKAIADIFRNTKALPQSFNYREFVDEVHKTVSCDRDDVINAYSRSYNMLIRTGRADNLLLIGPPGTGKTVVTEALARASGMPLKKVSLNGISNVIQIKGHQEKIGNISNALTIIGNTGVLLLDEIDKLANADALLDLLDSKQFKDEYFDIQLDCSNLIIVATANYPERIAPEIFSRFEVISVDGYTKAEKKNLLHDYIIPKQLNEAKANVEIDNDCIDYIINNYSYSVGVRELNTAIRKLIGDALLFNEKIITRQMIVKSLGVPIPKRSKHPKATPGIINGLSVNSASGIGSLFEIQCVKAETDKPIGNVKDCLSESFVIAKYVASRYLDNADSYYVQYGDGSTPKDGPSAGLASALAMISCSKGISINNDYAFTGEISVSGFVHAIGGLVEKAEAAKENGCSRVYIPMENYNNLTEKETKKLSAIGIEIKPVTHIDELIDEFFTENLITNTTIKRIAI